MTYASFSEFALIQMVHSEEDTYVYPIHCNKYYLQLLARASSVTATSTTTATAITTVAIRIRTIIIIIWHGMAYYGNLIV